MTHVPITSARRRHGEQPAAPGCHSVDENLERRNHYLDLAGIENYTSRFGAGEWTGLWGGRGFREGGGGALKR
ncbi:Protein naked cuticle 1 [Liparis tanakae]|uniref:Protein naked cuticle 1 n=1 Tax=Liparis tanakae TaxID=230148 RepID=A0A4Z2E504_9TELE|nr:Protein naked cuticle 1 [Liparis tanakae]